MTYITGGTLVWISDESDARLVKLAHHHNESKRQMLARLIAEAAAIRAATPSTPRMPTR